MGTLHARQTSTTRVGIRADGGKTWDPPKPSPLVAHNTPVALWRLDNSPEIVAVWNNSPRSRWPLTVALSKDEGRTWTQPRELANTPGFQTSYPSMTQSKEGNLVVVWQQQLPEKKGRDIRYARFNRTWLLEPNTDVNLTLLIGQPISGGLTRKLWKNCTRPLTRRTSLPRAALDQWSPAGDRSLGAIRLAAVPIADPHCQARTILTIKSGTTRRTFLKLSGCGVRPGHGFPGRWSGWKDRAPLSGTQ
jgi:hypothetical protein